MNILRSKKSFHYTASIAAHALVLFLMVATFDTAEESPLLGNTTARMINSFMVSDRELQSQSGRKEQSVRNVKQSVLKEQSQAAREKPVPHALPLRHSKPKTRAAAQQPDSGAPAAGPNQGVQTEALLAMLHSAIQKQQHYPLSAMQLERQGRATVRFTLFTDGRIASLRIARSSGTGSLDDAALAAVQDAAPFSNVNKYLESAREFSIDVVFELT